MRRLGLIAGGGSLPISLARHCQLAGQPIFVVRLAGAAAPALNLFPGADVGLAELGKGIRALREAGCDRVCFAGLVSRPDFRTLKPDLRGMQALPGAIAAARRGDDSLLSFMVAEFERDGFIVVGAHNVMAELTMGAGPAGKYAADPVHEVDIARAMNAARTIGALDAGQGAVSCDGLILALEAQEGTDAMLSRVAILPPAIRGSVGDRRGVLAKVCKPQQDMRVDLPTIGPQTVRLAAEAGLAGIVAEAGKFLILDRDTVVSVADQCGLFLIGAP
jgi:DUF1009 family protein